MNKEQYIENLKIKNTNLNFRMIGLMSELERVYERNRLLKYLN